MVYKSMQHLESTCMAATAGLTPTQCRASQTWASLAALLSGSTLLRAILLGIAAPRETEILKLVDVTHLHGSHSRLDARAMQSLPDLGKI